jgi:hypothetical protein
LIEVVREALLGDLFCCPTVGSHDELGLGWSSGGVKGRGRGGLTDVGEDLGNRLRVRQNRSEAELAEGVAGRG